jgi:hypothetical protein
MTMTAAPRTLDALDHFGAAGETWSAFVKVEHRLVRFRSV